MTRDLWESRYAAPERVWSGRVNPYLDEVAGAPGRALDLACGEGADALWLAQRGWRVTAVDFAPSALRRGAQAAAEAGVGGRIDWVEADLATWAPEGRYDLVTVFFFHSPVADEVLRMAWQATAGTLLVVAHDPANAVDGTAGGPPAEVLYGADHILRAIGLPAADVAERRYRTSGDGRWVDAVVVASRGRSAG